MVGGLRDNFLSGSPKSQPQDITGCILSGLLSVRHEELPPTIGRIDVEMSRRHYEMLDRLGFKAAQLHLEDFPLDEESIREFRARFGTSALVDPVSRELRPDPALVPIQPTGTRRPLFFVHPIGGNVLCYFELARAGSAPTNPSTGSRLRAWKAEARRWPDWKRWPRVTLS